MILYWAAQTHLGDGARNPGSRGSGQRKASWRHEGTWVKPHCAADRRMLRNPWFKQFESWVSEATEEDAVWNRTSPRRALRITLCCYERQVGGSRYDIVVRIFLLDFRSSAPKFRCHSKDGGFLTVLERETQHDWLALMSDRNIGVMKSPEDSAVCFFFAN